MAFAPRKRIPPCRGVLCRAFLKIHAQTKKRGASLNRNPPRSRFFLDYRWPRRASQTCQEMMSESMMSAVPMMFSVLSEKPISTCPRSVSPRASIPVQPARPAASGSRPSTLL